MEEILCNEDKIWAIRMWSKRRVADVLAGLSVVRGREAELSVVRGKEAELSVVRRKEAELSVVKRRVVVRICAACPV